MNRSKVFEQLSIRVRNLPDSIPDGIGITNRLHATFVVRNFDLKDHNAMSSLLRCKLSN